ncbi:MAG: hypothetical protein COX48_01875 [bacterium (Candidatus Stahlbacteria) CG23_combo_of_CG06-09_8_20_14_all_34_7]|nr:MAG: hypothetical protein COX48_01875 [bacterium (Candidatus Stahlbacteria) CG23_combo_of_CG06-09_8_20_14_all_34_7]
MKQKIKTYFLAGLLVVIPIVVTAIFSFFIIEKVGGLWNIIFRTIPFVKNLPNNVINFVGLILSLVIIIFLGFIGQNYLGRFLFNISEKFFMSTPIIKNIYSPAKEIADTILNNKSTFKKVVFIEYLHKNQYTIAFVTSEKMWKINSKDSVTLFIPTSPNPTSGFFAVVPKDEVIESDLSVEYALKVIVSSGLIVTKEVEINDRKN